MKIISFLFTATLLVASMVFFSCQKDDPFVNTPPEIEDQQFSINENSTNSTLVGNVEATDDDLSQTLTYSIISGNLNDAFIINQTTGSITVNNYIVLDYETHQSFSLQVKVQDNYTLSLSDTALITINIRDILELLPNAYYPFNGNANDISGNNLNATNFGATLAADRFGNPNRAYHFNGIDQYIDFPNNALLKPQFPFTISFWVKLDQYDNSNQILTTDYKLDYYTGVWFVIATGRVTANFGNDTYINVNARRSCTGSTVLELNQWYHVCCIFKSATEAQIFLNGEDDGAEYSGGATSLVYSNNPGSVGRKDCGNDTQPPYYFKGSVDDIAFYNRVLTDSEVKSLYVFK